MRLVIYSFCLVALAACGPAPAAPVAAPPTTAPAAIGRMEALRIASQVYAPSLPGEAVHTAPTEDGFTCDSVIIEGTILRACGRGASGMDSLVATGEKTNPEQRFGAMAAATKAVFSVVDPGADPAQFARVQREVEAATNIGGDNVRACTPGACVKVTATPELWSLVATAPTP